MRHVFSHCTVCDHPIFFGEKYGSLNFNIESCDKVESFPFEVINVERSEGLENFCQNCLKKHNASTVYSLVDAAIVRE